RRILMRQNEQYTGRSLGVARIELRDPRTRDRALHHHCMTRARQREFGRIARGARNFETSVHAVDRSSDDLVRALVEAAVVVVHATAPAFCNARATVRCARSTLNALSRNGAAPATAASLADAMVCGFSDWPTS